LASTAEVKVTVCDRTPARADNVAATVGGQCVAARWHPRLLDDVDVLLLGTPIDDASLDVVETGLSSGVPVVSVADSVAEVDGLRAFDATARAAGTHLVIGAGMSPGLSDVLARQAAAGFEEVDEIHVAKAGTAGPACARQHHLALGGEAIDWREGAWVRRPGGSGRELCWFPDPVGGQDCYRASLPDALLLQPAFPHATRITARVAATRRDRMTAALPMLRRPHPEGGLGAVRVEVRGRRHGSRDVRVLGAIDRPSVASGAVAALAALWAAGGRLDRVGAGGLAELMDDSGPFLTELSRRGVKAAAFEGTH
jgi:saccharopine dehydrogenase-like NADP-dependent oxidoreductase